MRSSFLALVLLTEKSLKSTLSLAPLPHKNLSRKMSATTKLVDADVPTQEWDVERYQSQHSFVYQYGTSLVDLAQPGQYNRILDLGCGSGELTRCLADAATQQQDNYSTSPPTPVVIGLDADPNMIQTARSQFPDLTFILGDMRSFELEEPVDLIFSNAALHWVPRQDAERAVQAISRALKPNGRFVAEFGGKGNVQNIVRACQEVLELPTDATPWYFPSISEYTSLLESHGIEVTSAVLFDRPTKLQGDDGISNWIRMFGNYYLENLTEEKKVQVLALVCDKLRNKLFDGEHWFADYRRIRIVGCKLADEGATSQ